MCGRLRRLRSRQDLFVSFPVIAFRNSIPPGPPTPDPTIPPPPPQPELPPEEPPYPDAPTPNPGLPPFPPQDPTEPEPQPTRAARVPLFFVGKSSDKWLIGHDAARDALDWPASGLQNVRRQSSK